MFYPVTADTIRTNLNKAITEERAEVEALKNVKINTKHKTLTNRSIENGRIGDYIGIGKALYVNYTINYPDGHIRYASRDISAYSYVGEDGKEIGTIGFSRISRTITPAELAVIVSEVIENIEKAITNLLDELSRAEEIAAERQKLIDSVNAFNDALSYASEARIK